MPLPQKRLIPGFLLLLMLAALAAPPSWWTDNATRVIPVGAVENHHGPANIGQTKHMISMALEALKVTVPSVERQIRNDLAAAYPDLLMPPANKTPEWIAKQKAPLLIGQLKVLAHPFYNHLNEANAEWVLQQIQLNHNDTAIEGTHYWHVTGNQDYQDGYYPWNPATPKTQNNAIATIGQLKAVFSLRFETLPPPDSDGDGYSDMLSLDQRLYLQLNDNSGTTATDSSGSHHQGLLVGGASFGSTYGIENGGVRLQGGPDALTLPGAVLNDISNLTISLWFKTSRDAASQSLISSASTAQVPEFVICIENNNRIRVLAGGGQSFTRSFGRSLADNRWHHLVLLRNTVTGQASLYLDAKPLGAAETMTLGALNANSVVLGQKYLSSSTFDTAQAFEGLLDEVRIYSQALEPEHLTELFRPNDLDGDGLPDDYEIALFDNLSTLHDADDDLDNDGLSNRLEYENGTAPDDYFNGRQPVIHVTNSGQTIYSGEKTSSPIIFHVTDGVNALANAPVSVALLQQQLGKIEALDGRTLSSPINLVTDSEGNISLHFKAN